MKVKTIAIVLLLTLLWSYSSAQKTEVYDCRTLLWESNVDITEYNETNKYIRAQVIDNVTGFVLREYNYPRKLLRQRDIKPNDQLQKYRDALEPYAKECPEQPTIETVYTDPNIYLIDGLGFDDEQEIKRYNSRTVETYQGYEFEYYETIDSIDGIGYVTCHLEVDSINYNRENAKVLIDSLDLQISVWSNDARERIDKRIARQTEREQESLTDKLARKFNMENRRKVSDNQKFEIIKSDGCQEWKEGKRIRSDKRIDIQPCKSGNLNDIDVRRTDRQVTVDGKLILRGDDIRVRILTDTFLKVKIKNNVDE